MGKRWRWVIAIAVVVGIIGVAGFFGGRHLIQQSRLAESCTKVQESLETQRDERVSIEAEPAQLVVIGDSYAQAIDTPVVESFPYVVAAGLDMNASVDAYGGSGYVNPGPCGDGNSFVDRVERNGIPPTAELVIVQGGVNDADLYGDRLRTAASDVLMSVADAAPAARVVVLGPASVPGSTAENVARADAILRDAAEAAGSEYVSTLDWEFDLAADQIHPSRRGQADYARLLLDAVGNGSLK